ncbi:hypothetical protein SAMN04515617_10522 [Collimonas sp. OK242]|uniref:hypothetical protein n=1 Tax=Collimonas sp. OK242 TaxID=1798195 RepID=UPI0008972066|nr:hypothetical protein [Collimonas sp. OK242]SDX58644.1 hypothetical protein SAMN04515617_10522 [Collimonas sp. OK242]
MQSSASTTVSSPAAKVRYDDDWSKTARGGFKVYIAWNRLNGGAAVSGMVCDTRGGESQFFSLDLDVSQQPGITLALVHVDDAGRTTFIDVTLTLVRDDDLISLKCNLPIAVNEFFYDAIGEWSTAPGPGPSPHPGPDDGGEIVIEAPGDATDLIPFIWLRPLSDAETADAALRFVRCKIPALLTLYASLDAAQKVSTATTYLNGSDFVKDIAGLGVTIALFPAARLKFMAAPGAVPVADLVSAAEAALSIPSLADFLQDAAWPAALQRVWQSIFALALAGQAVDAALSNQLLDILRVGQYLTLLTLTDDALTHDLCRQIALSAIVAIPDNVAILPPVPAISGADTATPPNTWEVLGVGKLKMARQHLAGYAPGELADVVNVMPRERQEMLERTVSTTTERSSHVDEQAQQSDTSRETSASSELADTIHEVMAADGMAVDMSGVTPQYSNLNLLLNGSGSSSQGRSAWSAADTSRMFQRLTEQAARRLGDRVSSQRGKEWQELRERRQSQLIDNTGNERLVGVYRWVDRVVRVHVEELGSRLVLAFVLEQPAQNWVAAVAAQGAVPLKKPAALPASYAAIQPGNYQDIGADYGLLELEAPPPSQVVLSATISRVTLGDLSLLCVPDGYSVASAAVTVALSDNTFNLACSICGHDLPVSSAPPTAAPTAAPALASASTPAPSGTLPPQLASSPLSVAVPACSTTGTGPALVNPPNQPTSVISTVTLTGLPITTGRIPVTVMSAAPLFCVTVTLTCTLIVPAAGTANSLLIAWQMRIYNRLQSAWKSAWKTYDAALHARIDQASAGHTGKVQRDTLKQACMSLLLQVSGAPGVSERLLEPQFDWAHMTWQYQSPTSASGNNWPQSHTSEATRPSSDRLFQHFLAAQAARVLLPVNSGWESWLLFYLQFKRPWIGGPARTLLTESTLPIMEELLRQDVEAGDHCLDSSAQIPLEKSRIPTENWTVRVPTSMIYLQQGAELPQMYRHRHIDPEPEV